MPNSYIEGFCHFVWATKNREAMINAEMEPRLHEHVRQTCGRLRVHVYALNGMPDHMHLVCSIPLAASIPDFVQSVKGGSSHFINQIAHLAPCLYWQPGYGLLTFSEDNLARVVSYVEHQKERHRTGRLSPKMERTEPPERDHSVVPSP
ncbi:MAG: IS200/IS605 family transposase [Armatimonadota bacterium]|nr:IS200/IS605 family transposase [Armatimonadota bacterium]